METADVVAAAKHVLDPLDGRLEELQACYVDLHEHPELSGQEVRTAGIVADRLAGDGYDVTTQVGGTGVVAVLRNGDGPTVALRADMDGLPVLEKTGVPYASKAVGRDAEGRSVPIMHACGHDAHVACLLGTAALLARARDAWHGSLLLYAQPAEETVTGARAMLRDGLYDRFGTPDVVLGQHVAPGPVGTVLHLPGPIMAATLSLDVHVFGRGGHGSRPEACVDPIVVGAHIVTRLQTIVSREIDPAATAVVTVGKFVAGTKSNVIPDEARLAINIRSYDDAVQAHVVEAIERIVRAEAEAGRAPRPPEITPSSSSPVTVNDGAAVAQVRAAHEAWMGRERVRDLPGRVMGSEDFGLFTRPDGEAGMPATVPSAFWFWGGTGLEQWEATPGETPAQKMRSIPGNHHPGFIIDPEPTLRVGVEGLTLSALAYMAGGAS